MKIQTLDSQGDLVRIVARQKGSWRWQDAYGLSRHVVHTTRDGRTVLRSLGAGRKFARTLSTAHYWREYATGSVHNAEVARTGVDDYGDQYWVLRP